MGNKQSKEILDKLTTAFEKQTTAAKNMSLSSLSEPEIITSLSNIISKKLKDTDIPNFKKSLHLNIAPEEKKEDVEIRLKKTKEIKLQSTLVVGHEDQPEIKSEFESVHLEDTLAPRLESVIDYTDSKIKNFLVTLLMLIEKAGSKKEAASFYQRIGAYLSADSDKKSGESSGTSTALYFAALLIDPKKLLTDTQISQNILEMFRTMPALSFYGFTKQSLIIDRSIEYIKRALLTQIENLPAKIEPTLKPNLENALKTLCYIGLARGSIEDFLIVVELLNKFDLEIDFSDILPKILNLPAQEKSAISITKESLDYQIPFEQIYIEKTEWLKTNDNMFSSATDGELVYFYSSTNGLMVLGAGKGRVKGKIYENKGMFENKGGSKVLECLHLMMIKGKLYGLLDNKIYKLDLNSMEMKESKKTAKLISGNTKVTASKNLLIVYNEKSRENEENENAKIEAEIYIHNLETKEEPRKLIIKHQISDIKQILACGNFILICGQENYEAIDLLKGELIKKDESELLKNSTLSYNDETHELFIIYQDSDEEGFNFGKFNLMLQAEKENVTFLENRINLIKETFAAESKDLTSESKELISRKELATLLGIYREPDEQMKKPENYAKVNKQEFLLSILALRAKQNEGFMKIANTQEPEELMKIYKSAIAIHLTQKCMMTLISLANKFYNEFLNSKGEDLITLALEKFTSVILILNEHFIALRKCNISLEDCIGPEGVKQYTKLCKEIITPITSINISEKYGIKNTDLTKSLKKYGNSCMSQSQALATTELDESFKLLVVLLRKFLENRKPETPLFSLITWLNTSDNIDLLGSLILSQNTECLELLNTYFIIEAEYFSEKTRFFIKKNNESTELQNIFKLLAPVFSQVIEKMFVSVGNKMNDKKSTANEVIMGILPGMLYPNLKRIMIEIKDSYGQYKSSMSQNLDELFKSGKLGPEYARYWKFIGNLLNSDLMIIHCFSILSTIIIGFGAAPDQLLKFVELLMKSADEIKSVIAELAFERADKNNFILSKLTEIFENADKPLKGSANSDKEFKFPDATKIHISTNEDIDIPLPKKNEIFIYEMPRNKQAGQINKTKPKFSGSVKGNHIRILANIDYVYSEKDIPYKGYSLKITPKYHYGQKILKETLRNIMWCVGYASKSALIYFDEVSKNVGISQRLKDELQNIMNSRLLSGGLPTSYFGMLFSAQFNKQFNQMKENLGAEFETNQFESEIIKNEDHILKEIMNGGNEKADIILKKLKTDYSKKQMLGASMDIYTEEVIRATFALLLKITGSINDWQSLVDGVSDENLSKKISSLWYSANRMRIVVTELKNKIPEDHKGEELEQDFKNLIKPIKEKVELLLKFRSAAIAEQEKISARKKIQLMKKPSEDAKNFTEAEKVKERLKKWKDIQLAVSPQEENAEISLSSAAIHILQSEITASQLVSQLETYYMRALVLYNVMFIIQHAISMVYSKKIRADILAWIMSIFKRTTSAPWHYSQLSSACGVSFQLMQRTAFFGVVKNILEYLSLTNSSKELACLMDALKWNYTATDHDYLNNTKLFSSLRGKTKNAGYIASLWGQSFLADEKISELLVDTFEFIVIKITTRILSVREAQNVEKREDFPSLEKSTSLVDESSTAKLFGAILETIFSEMKRAIDSYENFAGYDSPFIEDYLETQKTEDEKKKKDDDSQKDRSKIKHEFIQQGKNLYSQEFCARLLGLLYHLCIAVQENNQLKTTINILIQHTDFINLFKLLNIGSIQHQFLILQIIPLLAKLSYENIEQAAIKSTEILSNKIQKYTNNGLLNILLNFVIERRESIWISEEKQYLGAYAMTKCAINAIKLILNSNKELCTIFSSLLKTIIFGKKEECEKLPSQCRSRNFIDALISIAGGEMPSLHKGGKAEMQNKKNYSIVCFGNSKDKQEMKDWEFVPKKHDEVYIHLKGDIGSTGETALTKINVSELIPKEEKIDLNMLFYGIKEEQVSEILMKTLKEPLSKDTLLATIQVKLLRIIMKYLNKNKSLTNKIITPEIAKLIFDFSLKTPKFNQNRSLSTTESLIEEMRKFACQNEGKALAVPETSLIMTKILKGSILLMLHSGIVKIPLIAHKCASKLLGNTFEFLEFEKNMQPNEANGKIVFIKDSNLENKIIEEISKFAKGIVIAKELEKFPEILNPLFEIHKNDMEKLNDYKNSLSEIDKFVQNNKLNIVLAEYIGIKPENIPKTDSVNIREILNDLTGNKAQQKEEIPLNAPSSDSQIKDEKEKNQAKQHPLRIFTRDSNKCDKMFKDRKDNQIIEEKQILKKEFSNNFSRIYERAEYSSPDSYSATLYDLKIFYFRSILSNLYSTNTEILQQNKNSELIPFLLTQTLESDYLLYGTGNKSLSKKINKIMKKVFELCPQDLLKPFAEWLNAGIQKMALKPKNNENLFGNNTDELKNTIYCRFVYRFLHILLKIKPKEFITYSRIPEIMKNLLILVAICDDINDKYRSILIIKEIMGTAQKLKNELSVEDCNRILANKCIRALSIYCKESKLTESMVWKNINEISFKANALYRIALEKFGEKAISHCVNDDLDLYVAGEIMKTFPDMKTLLSHCWTKLYHKDSKIKNEIRIATPKPNYDTQYCLLIYEPIAQAIEIDSKKDLTSIGITSLDKQMKAKLESLDNENEKLTLNFNKFYLHFPVSNYSLYGFGSNENGRLGLKDAKTNIEFKQIPRFGINEITGIYSGGSHTIVLDSRGNKLSTGKGDGKIGADRLTFEEYTKRNIDCIATNQVATIIYDSAEDRFYVHGKNPDRMFSISSSSCNEESFRPIGKDIKQISCSANHTLMLYGDKGLYAAPEKKKQYFGSWVEGPESKFNQVKLEENFVKINKILAVNSGSLLLATTNKSAGKNEIWSYGENGPWLGLGDNPTFVNYTRLDYPEDIEFIDIQGCENMVVGITKKGELYSWGKASKGALGLFKEDCTPIEEISKPTKVMIPEKYNVLSASVGFSHMLVLTEEKDTKKKIIFAYGDNSKGQLGHKDVNLIKVELDYFSDKNPYMVCAGNQCSFVACGRKCCGISHLDCKCVNHKEQIDDILYLTKYKEKGVQYYCEKCEDKLPEISMMVRNPIKKISERPWPILDELKKLDEKDKLKITKIDCSSCKNTIENAAKIHLSAVKENPGILCEKCAIKTQTSFMPAIYYRINNLETYKNYNLPIFSLSDFYEFVDNQMSLILTPKYKITYPAHLIDKSVKPTLEEFLEEQKLFEHDHDMDLTDILNEYLIDKDKDVDKLKMTTDLGLSYSKRTALTKFSEEVLKRRTKVLIKLNKIIHKAMQLIDFDTKSMSEDDLYNYYVKVKDYVATKTKDQVTKKVINDSATTKGRTEVVIDRHKAHLLKMSGGVDYNGSKTMFGQLWRSLRDKVLQFRKKQKKDKFPFKIKFKGEGGIDAGGLFRDCIDNICEELQSNMLPLLIPTPNNKNAYGEYREKWMLNPSAKQATHLEMLEFLGSMIGMSFRLGHVLALNMPSIFWKQLMSEPVDRNDLRIIDKYSVQCLEDIAKIDKTGITPAEFDEMKDYNFTTHLSDGSEVEIKKGGKDMRVVFDNRLEYVQLVEKTRLEENNEQMKVIRQGMFKIIPQSLVKLYSWRELEIRVCGKATFKVEQLKKITRYSGCNEKDNHIQYFWQALEEFTDEERSLYLRFVWGRSRMPSYFEKAVHEIHVLRSTTPDLSLPASHTWYFCIFIKILLVHSSWICRNILQWKKQRKNYAMR